MRKPRSPRNADVRQMLIDNHLCQMDVVEVLQIGQTTLQYWLRQDECGGHKQQIIQAIKQLVSARG